MARDSVALLECAEAEGGAFASSARRSASPEEICVMKAIAHHNISTCHEHLHQYEPALAEARRARRLAQSALPAGEPLLVRLRTVDRAIERMVRAKAARVEQLIAQGRRGVL